MVVRNIQQAMPPLQASFPIGFFQIGFQNPKRFSFGLGSHCNSVTTPRHHYPLVARECHQSGTDITQQKQSLTQKKTIRDTCDTILDWVRQRSQPTQTLAHVTTPYK
jgi:hypothetical protein